MELAENSISEAWLEIPLPAPTSTYANLQNVADQAPFSAGVGPLWTTTFAGDAFVNSFHGDLTCELWCSTLTWRLGKASFIPEIDAAVSKDPRWALLQRVASSEQFRSSTRLREFLLYVGECAIRDSPKDATEQQIGIHVFHRTPGYNSSEDNIVRTHARLLRRKLAEYFSDEGAQEKIIIEIPKGHYLPVFQPAGIQYTGPRPVEPPPLHEDISVAPAVPIASKMAQGRPAKLWLAIAGCFIAILFAATIWRARPRPRAVESDMETLWGPFLAGSQPLLIYSSESFVEVSNHGHHPASADAETSSNQSLRENYGTLLTGAGAVVAVHDLAQLFEAHHATFILKRSDLVTWDAARSKNLIFIGSKASNSALNMLPSLNDFTLLADPNSIGFINNHPKPGEPKVYSPPPQFTKDYAVLALLPGLRQGKWILIFSGLSTLGSEAAVEYACRPQDVAALLRAASFKNGGIHPFEALLETTVVGGVPMEAKLVTIRTH